NYLGDPKKNHTARTAHEHIQTRMTEIAKERIFDPSKSVSQIAYEMGFKYPQHFTRLFKRRTGLTPVEYRSMN
ncbi:MAG: helix-turn-helix domain-containing protein, partial [Alistipes sp.]|nr:helix-turn-helix domain-containing protein [Alistipes sp.]